MFTRRSILLLAWLVVLASGHRASTQGENAKGTTASELDCNEDGVFDESQLGRKLIRSVEMPGLVIYLDGYANGGPIDLTEEFEFGTVFLDVHRAWLQVDGDAFFGITMNARIDGVAGPSVGAAGFFSLCVPVPVVEAMYAGSGEVALFSDAGCCDIPYSISSASLWVEAVTEADLEPLNHFAEFQNCFAPFDGRLEPSCANYDLDDSMTVDWSDFQLLFRER